MSRTRFITQAGVIAAVYAALTWLTLANIGVLAWGPIQFRLSEALTILPLFTPAAIPGLAIGSVIANAFNPQAVWPFSLADVLLGSLGTLLGAIWTWRFRSKTWLALLGPVVCNALIVAAYLPAMIVAIDRALNLPGTPVLGLSLTGAALPLYAVFVLTIGVGEAIVVYGLGLPLYLALRRSGIGDRLGR